MARSGAQAGSVASVSMKKLPWVKALVHSLHHSSGSVIGVLIGSTAGGVCTIDDAVPLFHTAMSAPISEVALTAVRIVKQISAPLVPAEACSTT